MAFNLWAAWRLRKRPATVRNAARRTRAATIASLVSGVLWGAGAVAFWPADQSELQVLILFLITGLTANALSALTANLAAYRSFLLPCGVGIVVAALGHGGLLNLFVAATAVIYTAANWHFANSMNRTLLESLRRRYEVQELAADLQVQRDLAEEASLSKSRFLAAASHDLRQPVHSLSLFVGAQAKGLRLRQRGQPLTVLCDVVLLDRILRNLVSNAVRYTEHGGVLVALQQRGDHALVSIVDSGIGIPQDR